VDKRIPQFENVPTTKEFGIDLTTGFWRGIVVKKGTPDVAITFLENLFEKAMETGSYQEYERKSYLHLRPGLLKSEDFGKFLEEEYDYFKKQL